jgi:transposase
VANRYRPVDRDQVFLLPPDMREWLADDHSVWLVLQVVSELDLSALHARRRVGGVGRAGYDPAMLTALLLYAYCVGQRSSRQIERLCQVDVAFRVVCAQDVPDHTVIARFRQRYAQELAELFAQVLVVCARAGLGRLGLVAIDGTKIAGNASLAENRSESWLREQAARMLREAQEVDAAEDALFGDSRGDELPPELADPAGRRNRIRQILADLDAERQTNTDGETAKECGGRTQMRALAAAEARAVHWQARYAEQVRRARQQQAEMLRRKAEAIAQGIAYPRRDPRPVEDYRRVRLAAARLERAHNERNAALRAVQAEAAERAERDARRAASTRRNLTDPDSRIMPGPAGGWIQGFNGQLAVSDDQLILAADVVDTPADAGQYQPMVALATKAAALIGAARGEPAAGIGTVLADAGYFSEANLTVPGPDRLIASGKGRSIRQAAADNPASGPPPAAASPREQMDHRLRTPEGQASYARRSVTVEPVFGQLKETRGFRRFARRGRHAAQAEWQLMATAHNLMKLHQARLAT